jgi:hypothetical protein
MGKKQRKSAQKVEDYLQDASTDSLTGSWEFSTWSAMHGEGRTSTKGEYHILTMVSVEGVYQAKIVKGSKLVTVGQIEEFGTVEPSLENVLLRFKARYNV